MCESLTHIYQNRSGLFFLQNLHFCNIRSELFLLQICFLEIIIWFTQNLSSDSGFSAIPEPDFYILNYKYKCKLTY